MSKLNELITWVKGEESSVQRQLHSLAAFCAAVLSMGTVIANISLGLIDEMLLFSALLVGSGFALWGLSRWTRLQLSVIKGVTVLLVVALVTVAWFLFAGSRGFTPAIMFWMMGLVTLFDRRRTQVFILLLFSALVVGLYLTELYAPERVNPYYASDQERLLDLMVSFGLAIIGMGVITLILSQHYRDAQARLTQAQLLRAEEEARAREEHLEMTRRMARGLAHDLRNVFMVISHGADFIEEGLAERASLDDELLEDLTAIKDSVEVATRLSQRLLDQSLTRDVPPQIIALTELTRAQCKLIERISEGVEVSFIPEASPQVSAHLSELEQVLMNLALNAIQAMKGEGQLTIRVRETEDMGVIEVEDNGPGIPLEAREKIFDPLFTTKAESGGTGVGLNTVRKIITRAQGRISFESELGVGTCFRVELPKA